MLCFGSGAAWKLFWKSFIWNCFPEFNHFVLFWKNCLVDPPIFPKLNNSLTYLVLYLNYVRKQWEYSYDSVVTSHQCCSCYCFITLTHSKLSILYWWMKIITEISKVLLDLTQVFWMLLPYRKLSAWIWNLSAKKSNRKLTSYHSLLKGWENIY